MIFAIEGPDGAGKTTLLNALRRDKRHTLHFVFSNRPPASWNEIVDELMWIDEFPIDQILILDRIRTISEYVYGKVLRGQSLVGHPIDDMFSKKAVYVYCRPPRSVILHNAKSQPQLEGVHARLTQLIEAYDKVFDALETTCDVIRYDYTSTPQPELLDQIFSRIKTNG
jgi:hypothetical protein